MGRGALIVLEGCDRCGKTTQALRLVNHLKTSCNDAQLIRFPDRSTAIGGLIDRYLRRDLDLPERSLHLLFSANRWELQSRLRTLLESGVHVVVDRYAFSGVAYSMAKGLDSDWARQADLGIIRPDTVLYFDMDPEKAAERGGFGDERLEDAKLQRRVYAEMKLLRQPYWQTVMADGTVEAVHEQIKELVESVVRKAIAGEPISLLTAI